MFDLRDAELLCVRAPWRPEEATLSFASVSAYARVCNGARTRAAGRDVLALIHPVGLYCAHAEQLALECLRANQVRVLCNNR